ncbi:unnamed protein product, partial [Adineta ricciae]
VANTQSDWVSSQTGSPVRLYWCMPIYNILSNQTSVFILHVLQPVLETLAVLSKSVQTKAADFEQLPRSTNPIGFLETELHWNPTRKIPSVVANFMNDGQIKKEKTVEVYDQLYSDGKSSDFRRFTFGLFNREDSGTIEFHELMVATGLRQCHDLQLRYGLAFSLFDSDNTNTMHTCDVIRATSVLLEAISQTDGQGDHHANRSAKKLIERYTVSRNNQLKRDQGSLIKYKRSN